MELAGNIRERVAYSLREEVSELDIISASDAYFNIRNGMLYTLRQVNARQSETVGITPDEIPLEGYDASRLLEIAKRIGAG